MALMGCVGSKTHEALLQAIGEAVKENSISRLTPLLSDAGIGAEEIGQKHLLHQAAWLGYPRCVKLLIEHGANPDISHRKNGCTPLHLAHFCTIEDTNPKQTIQALLQAGASVNNPGSHKCGKFPVDHAIQHQRLDSVQILLAFGSLVTTQSILITIDVANPQILELLLLNRGQCGRPLQTTMYWGEPLHRVLYAPLKCPKECYKQMFKLLTQASVCHPMPVLTSDAEAPKNPTNMHLMIETDLKILAKDYIDLTEYLYVFLIRNGLRPTESMKLFMTSLRELVWLDDYLGSPPPLRDLCVRVVRSCSLRSGNILYGVSQLDVPKRIKHLITMPNPY